MAANEKSIKIGQFEEEYANERPARAQSIAQVAS